MTLARKDDINRQFSIHRARAAIYDPDPMECLAVDSAYVERQLKPTSLVPTSVSDLCVCLFSYAANGIQQNAFSNRLAKFGFNLFTIFPVDLMHEIELGVWKSLLIHLLRILEAVDENLLHDLDRRSVILFALYLCIGYRLYLCP